MKRPAVTLLVALAFTAPACSNDTARQMRAYCASAQRVEDAFRLLISYSVRDSRRLENVFLNAKAQMDQVDPSDPAVPAGVRADLTIVRDAFYRSLSALENANWTLAAGRREVKVLFEDKNVAAAHARLDTANKAKCPAIVLARETPASSP